MFEFIRTHRRLMQFILLLFIFPSFAFFGLESYTQFRDRDQAVAKVAGQAITQQELENAQREQMERFRQMFGQQFDPSMLDTPEARRNILDGLITDRVLIADAADKRLSVADDTLRQTILAIPGVTENGKFDLERYKALLASRGMNPTIFQANLRRELLMEQQTAPIQSSVIVPKTVAARIAELNAQQREVQEMLFKPSDYVSQVKVTDEMVKAYYDNNSNQFEIPEQVKAEYAVLSLDALASQISVSDEEIKAYYEQNAQRFAADEQRRASHILLPVDKNASDADKAAVRAKAQQLVAQLRQNPGEFGKLAKQHSQDPGSAEKGGDLGFFGRGMMVKPFEEAVYKMNKGEISDPVESDFGFHVIMVTDVKAKSLDDVRAEIAAEIKKQKSAKKYAQLAEQFTDIVYEQSDSLKPVAEKLGLKIETIDGLTRTPKPNLPPNAPYNQPKFLSALFSDDAIKNKRNTEAVEVAPNTLIAGRVVEYKPVTTRPFEEVQAAIRERLIQVEAAKLAKKAGEEKLAQLKANAKNEASGFSTPKLVSRTANQDLPPPALNAVMRADASQLPAYAGVDLGGRGFGIYKITKVAQPPATDETKRQTEQLQQQIANVLAQQETVAYVNTLKNKVNVEILNPFLKNNSTENKNPNE